MIDLSPKNQFQTLRGTEAQKWRELVAEPATRSAMTHALACLSLMNTTSEELSGARKYMMLLATIADTQEKVEFPRHDLQSFGDGPPPKLQ